MSQLLALSYDAPASPTLVLTGAERPWQGQSDDAYGWGMAWYPPDDRAAAVIKDPAAVADDTLARVVRDWSRFRSTNFVCHIRGARARRSQEDTQPFARTLGTHDWIIAHAGDLDRGFAERLDLGPDPLFEPIGHTDTEHLFCWLLARLRAQRVRSLAEVGWKQLHQLLDELNGAGQLSLTLTDGLDLVGYRDREGHCPLQWGRRNPRGGLDTLDNDELSLELCDPRDRLRTVAVVTSQPLSAKGWQELLPGELLVLRRGAVIWSSRATEDELNRLWLEPDEKQRPARAARKTAQAPATNLVAAAPAIVALGGTSADADRPPVERAVLDVRHETRYSYAEPVELSRHFIRLFPIVDRNQEVLDFQLELLPRGNLRHYEDVFGNRALRVDLEEPFSEMTIRSRARVLVKRDLTVAPGSGRRRTTIPIPWMPWDRQMMLAYLLPAELPETQLRELFDYAMSFVERQDYDLLETLDDLNRTIFREWVYTPGHTTVETTPFEVYAERRGVCQDFANLMITLARLIGIPARYRTGYIFTGGDYENRLQSDASHAWVELYLPRAGWIGFDPTNGFQVGLDHVRVACGRNFRDATPTKGTIFRGGGRETLKIQVEVRRVEET